MKKPVKNIGKIKSESTLINDFDKSLTALIEKIDAFVYPLIIPPRESIDEDVLFKIYPDLKRIGKQNKLHVLLYSYGGDAHTAFHIGRLLQEYGKEELKIYILREAKSAATLLASSADVILFTEISELGPMDPQIHHPKIDERFSPLAIKHTLELLHTELALEHTGVVQELISKLPDPITLGEALKSLDTGKDYLYKLLKARMCKEKTEEQVKEIAKQLVVGYPDHGYCIDYLEAKDIGLKVEKVPKEIEYEVYMVMRIFKEIWEKFEFLFQKSTSPKDEDFKEALSLLLGIRKTVANIVKKQIKRKPAEKQVMIKNNGAS